MADAVPIVSECLVEGYHPDADNPDILLSGSSSSEEEPEELRNKRRKRECLPPLFNGSMQPSETQDGLTQDMEVTPSSRFDNGASFNTKYVPWTKEEDRNLRQLVDHLGPKNWSNIAAQMPSRTSKSCRLRWLNQLRPNVQTGCFTPEEDQVIIQAQGRMGNRWTAIAAMLPGRTDNAVKNRWNSALRKRVENPLMSCPQDNRHDSHSHNSTQQQQEQHSHRHNSVKQHLENTSQIFSPSSGQRASDAVTMMGQQQQQQQQQQFVSRGQSNSSLHFLEASRIPAPPPSSNALVATAPPFNLPLPLMTLQPQMSAKEAAAALAAANCNLVKKVSETNSMQSVTSTAMVALVPPPTCMAIPPTSSTAATNPEIVSSQQQSLAMQQLMTSHLAAKLFQQQHSSHPTTMAMVASSPPPIVMTLPESNRCRPAVSWQLPSAIHPSQPLAQEVSKGPHVKLEFGVTQEADLGPGPKDEAPRHLDQSQSHRVPDLAQLLLMQEQQMQQQQAILQQLSMLSSAQSQNAVPPGIKEEFPQIPPSGTSQASIPRPSTGTASKLDAQSMLAAVLEGASGGMNSELVALVSAGGHETLQHLLTLGMGTLMAAASLRQQGHGASTLAMAQLQSASHPSAQALLLLLQGSSGRGGHQSVTACTQLNINSLEPSSQQPPQELQIDNSSLGSPLGSMSDLASLFDNIYNDPNRPSTCFDGGLSSFGTLNPHQNHDTMMMNSLDNMDVSSPRLRRQLMDLDPTLGFLQSDSHPPQGSSQNLLGLLDDI